jgi:hypothetical protein
MEMLHDIVTYERSLMHPLHPHQIADITVELRFMFATMHHLSDWTLASRVTTLLRRAHLKILRQCHEFLQRSEALVVACRIHQHSLMCSKNEAYTACRFAFAYPLPPKPSFVAMDLAIASCDDVLQYFEPAMKETYIRNLRPQLVAFMCDSESGSSDCESDNSHSGCSAAKRLCTHDDDDRM